MLWRPDARVLIIGDVFVDCALDAVAGEPRVRLGGVFHAAHALNAFGVPYAIAYWAPEYLQDDITRFAGELGAEAATRVGIVRGAPSVMLIREAREAGDQGYDDILRDARQTTWDAAALASCVERVGPTDALVVPGAYPLASVVSMLVHAGVALHVDTQYDTDLDVLWSAIGDCTCSTLFLSTSSRIFHDSMGGDPGRARDIMPSDRVADIVLKENRGGSRAILASRSGTGEDEHADAPSFPVATAHSVGVGDCFDCAWVASNPAEGAGRRLRRAAYLAARYAATWDQERFRDTVRGALAVDDEVVALAGARVAWERRPDHAIYLAAPDFPDVDTTSLDALEAALRYHNFSVHRPVRDCGLYTDSMSPREARSLYAADRSLLDTAALVIAVPLTPDPGTFTELGLAHGLGIRTILWAQERGHHNLFAFETATRVTRSLAGVIDETFALIRCAPGMQP